MELVGVEVCTIILGVDAPRWFSESLLALTDDGGGDFNLGDCGHVGVLSPDPAAERGCIFGNLETASVTEPAGNCGTLVADKALWMAAADGTVPVGVDKAAGRCGLCS